MPLAVPRLSEVRAAAGDKLAVEVPRPSVRLLFATSEPCPTFRADVAVLFGKYLPRSGVSSDLITERAPAVAGEVRWEGGDCILAPLRSGKAGKHLTKLALCACAMFRADRASYHAIQVRDMPLVGLLALVAARLKGLHFFYWMSFPTPEYHIRLARGRGLSTGLLGFLNPWVRGRIERFLLYGVVLPRADHVFVQSERMREDVAARGIPSRKMTPVVMGIDREVVRPERIAPSDDPRLTGRRVLVYLGTLDRNRRIDLLLEMLAMVRRRFPDTVLALVGEAEDEPHERWLRMRAEQLGVVEATIWTGWLPIEDGWRYVRAADVGLSPFPRGPLLDSCSPTKLLEYLALGVPVVGNDNPDQQRVLDEGGGGLCVPLAPDQFAQAVCRLLADETIRCAMAASGRSYVLARRSYALLADTVASKYAELLGAPTFT